MKISYLALLSLAGAMLVGASGSAHAAPVILLLRRPPPIVKAIRRT